MELWIIIFSPHQNTSRSQIILFVLFSPARDPHTQSQFLLLLVLLFILPPADETVQEHRVKNYDSGSDLQKSLEALRVPDLLWRREKRPFLLRKRLILARLAAGHVPASLPSPPAWGLMQPKSALGHPCAAPHLSSLPPKASTQLGKSNAPIRSHL